jgi:hypothetical protein
MELVKQAAPALHLTAALETALAVTAHADAGCALTHQPVHVQLLHRQMSLSAAQSASMQHFQGAGVVSLDLEP